MPRPKNYSFEKVQRERARLARKEARRAAKAKGGDDAPEDAAENVETAEGEAAKDEVGGD